MLVAPARILRNASEAGGQSANAPISLTKNFPAPNLGWFVDGNIAAMPPGSASLLENFIPTLSGIRTRKGCKHHATLSGEIEYLLTYEAYGIEKIFACTSSSIFDATVPADPSIILQPVVNGQKSGDYSSTLFSTAGGAFLIAVNGCDLRLVYDGSSWNTTPAITGIDSARFSYVWPYKNRLFFIERSSLKVWFLGVDSVGGSVQDISLAGVFKHGGELLFGSSWSTNVGDGLSEMCAFVTSNGEVALYRGSNPANPSDWSIVGVYELDRPLGKNAHFKAGGDILIATEGGLVPLSASTQKDPSSLKEAAVSRAIGSAWADCVTHHRGLKQWSIAKYSSGSLGFVAPPLSPTEVPFLFIVNLISGAWTKFIGWDVKCFACLGDRLFFGTRNGKIMLGNVGGSDDGENYYCRYVASFDSLDGSAHQKNALMIKATYRSSTPFSPRISVAANYASDDFQPDPPVAAPGIYDVWDVGRWDTAVWDASELYSIATKWQAVSGYGFTLAPRLQISCGSLRETDVELLSIDLLYAQAGVAV